MPLKFILSFILLFFLVMGVYQLTKFYDGKMHIVVCNVGQGDAIYIRSPKGYDILFDGGPDAKVIECLSKYKPLWERDIDLLILSHPHADHLQGFLEVLRRYKVKAFATEKLRNNSGGFTALEKMLKEEKIVPAYLFSGDLVKTGDGVVMTTLSPDKEYLDHTSQEGVIRESGEFASLILLLSYGQFDMLLTGDTQSQQLSDALSFRIIPPLEILQAPHHGSQTGLTESILIKNPPKTVVISVGKNSYGHPSLFTLGLLNTKDMQVLRTDERGNIVLKTNGESYIIN